MLGILEILLEFINLCFINHKNNSNIYLLGILGSVIVFIVTSVWRFYVKVAVALALSIKKEKVYVHLVQPHHVKHIFVVYYIISYDFD